MAEKKGAIGRLVQKGLDSSIEKARQKGQERLTIMLIPHGQEKIFSLQLNYQMIFFLLGILFLVVGLSFYGFYRKAQKELDADRLRSQYGLNFRGAMTLKEISGDLGDLNETLYSNLKEIASLTGVPDEEIQELPEISSSYSRANNQLEQEIIQKSKLGAGRNFLPPVYSLKRLTYAFSDQVRALSTVERLVGQGIGLYSAMPMGRPFTEKEMLALRDTSGFGMRVDPFTNAALEMHAGQDIAGPDGTPVRATGTGEVQSTGYDMGYGNRIVVKHGSAYYSTYSHLQRILVRPGEIVRRGQVIGQMGRTGRVTGSHLHYEVWVGDQRRTDPVPYMCAYDFRSDICR
ncbi:MAG TPA: M23 family metallopeptidase [Leptospiraceae bacterium]|nr:M23 family metallopeptidase [Leptospiraceae bacterium]HNE22834.1 M23 family metallopeptidase [Leptospiraceae bacterium]